VVFVFLILTLVPLAQAQSAAKKPAGSKPAAAAKGDTAVSAAPDANPDPHRAAPPAPPEVMQGRKKFVTDVVNAAIGLPQGDPQDRLRVLAAAADVMSSIDPQRSREFANEGVHLEIQLITAGQKPAVSLMERGEVKCSVAQEFVEMVPLASVPQAEQSILG